MFEPTLLDARPNPVRSITPAGVAFGLLVIWGLGFLAAGAQAQPPGTPPPEQWTWKNWAGIRPEAFLFLDESRTPVVMPRMSFEEIERLRRLDLGAAPTDDGVLMRQLEVTGTVQDQRAELTVKLKFAIEPAAFSTSGGPTPAPPLPSEADEAEQRPAAESAAPDERTAGDSGSRQNGPGSEDSGKRDSGQENEDDTEADTDGADPATVVETAPSVTAGDDATLYPRRPPLIVPLQMQGFHLLEPPEIEGVEGARVRLAASAKPQTRENGETSSGRPLAGSTPPGTSLMPTSDATTGRTRSSADGPTGPGYQLWIPVSGNAGTPVECVLTMRVSAKVHALGPSVFALPVRLPVVPTTMTVDINEQESAAARTSVTAEVVGEGREVLQRVDTEGSTPRFRVESEGGAFSIHWQRSSVVEDAARLLEVTSDAELRWQSPTEAPTMDVRLQVENLRGRLQRVEVEIPEGMVLLRAPKATPVEANAASEPGFSTAVTPTWRLVDSNASNASNAPNAPNATDATEKEDGDGGPNASRRGEQPGLVKFERVDPRSMPLAARPTADSGRPTVEIRLTLQSPVPDADPAQPWTVRLPRVVDAIAQRGEVTIRTTEDHRLRWRPQPGVEAATTTPPGSVAGEQTHVFRFARNAFGLPIWLSTKQRQTRVSVDAALAVNRQSAVLSMLVQGQGSGIDPKDLRLELGQWRLRSLETGSEDAPMPEISESDGLVEWQVDTSEGKWPDLYRIEVERAWEEGTETLELPRLLSVEPSSVVSDVTVELVRRGREAWVVDLPASPGIQRVFEEDSERYRLLSVDDDWEMTGSFVRRPLRLKLAGQTVLNSRDEVWTTRTSWEISSDVDLEGRLSFDYPTPAARGVQWAALVEGMPATVRPSETRPDRWQIVSPRLSSGTVTVDLTGEVPFTLALGEIDPRRAGGRANGAGGSTASEAPESPPGSSPPGIAEGLGSTAALGPAAPNREEPFAAETPTWIAGVPRPVADNLDLESPYRLEIAELLADRWGRLWQIEPAEPRALYDLQPSASRRPVAGAGDRDHVWLLADVPDFAMPLAIRSTASEERMVKVPRALIRSLVSDQTRHEHLIATVEGGQRIRLELAQSLTSVRIEATFDGQPVLIVRQRDGLVLDLPEIATPAAGARRPPSLRADQEVDTSGRPHLLDVRLWAELESGSWWSNLQPLMQLPVQSGWVYWELIVPSDAHLFWASPSSGRAMRWQREQLRMLRRPLLDDEQLVDWATGRAAADGRAGSAYGPFRPAGSDQLQAAGGGEQSASPGNSFPPSWIGGWEADWDPRWTANPAFSSPGNRYLFYAGESYAFSAATVSRTALWLIVGGLMVGLSTIFHLFPRLRHPTVAVALAVGLAGVLVVAPDGIVLTGQLVLISLALVAVLYAVAALVTPSSSRRVLQPRSTSPLTSVRERSRRPERPAPDYASGSRPRTATESADVNGSSAASRLNPWDQRGSAASEPLPAKQPDNGTEDDSTWTARRQDAAEAPRDVPTDLPAAPETTDRPAGDDMDSPASPQVSVGPAVETSPNAPDDQADARSSTASPSSGAKQ